MLAMDPHTPPPAAEALKANNNFLQGGFANFRLGNAESLKIFHKLALKQQT